MLDQNSKSVEVEVYRGFLITFFEVTDKDYYYLNFSMTCEDDKISVPVSVVGAKKSRYTEPSNSLKHDDLNFQQVKDEGIEMAKNEIDNYLDKGSN